MAAAPQSHQNASSLTMMAGNLSMVIYLPHHRGVDDDEPIGLRIAKY